METPIQTPATQTLDALGLPYRVVQHDHHPKSAPEAAALRGQKPEQVVRSLLFRLEDGSFVMVLIPGGYRAHWPTLRRYLGQRRITMATPEEVRDVTGYPVGTVCPLGLPTPIRILADERIFQQPELSMGAGVFKAAIILTPDVLQQALPQLEISTFATPAPQRD